MNLLNYQKKVIKAFSKMNTYSDSSGKRYTSAQIDSRIRRAKEQKMIHFVAEHGFIFCEDCKRSDLKPIDCSHDISVDKCKKNGQVEKAWDVNNITLRCRGCHRKHDNLGIEQNKIKG